MDFFSLSKTVWFFAAPSHLLVWILALGVLSWRSWFGRILIIGVAGFLVLLQFVPLGDWAVASLENQFPRGPWPAHVDGVLELGGGLNSTILTRRGVPGATSEGRVVATFEAARRYPKARIVFSGGGDPQAVPEAVVARYVLEGQLGLPPGRVLYEKRSRDTFENFLYSKPLAKPAPGETWLLVTSAFHMPRAMAVARQAGWAMIPWPSDYLTTGQTGLYHQGESGNLEDLDLAAHEWVGLLAYRLAGRAR